MATARFRFDISQKLLAGIDKAVRRQLGPIASQLGAEMIATAKELTGERLTNDRPEDRRNPETSKGKPHYIDSFKLGAPDLSGGRVRVVLRNIHPGAKPIEEGTPGHTIDGPGRFPYVTTRDGGAQYAAPHKTKPKVLYGGRRAPVEHPGTPPQEIMKDTRQWAADNIADVVVRIQAALKK